MTDVEHAVIARYRLADDGFGEQDQRSTMPKSADGNEFGGGQVTLYAAMAPALRSLPFRPAHVILRYGSASDSSATEHRVDL